jgi:hypothetical protein
MVASNTIIFKERLKMHVPWWGTRTREKCCGDAFCSHRGLTVSAGRAALITTLDKSSGDMCTYFQSFNYKSL